MLPVKRLLSVLRLPEENLRSWHSELFPSVGISSVSPSWWPCPASALSTVRARRPRASAGCAPRPPAPLALCCPGSAGRLCCHSGCWRPCAGGTDPGAHLAGDVAGHPPVLLVGQLGLYPLQPGHQLGVLGEGQSHREGPGQPLPPAAPARPSPTRGGTGTSGRWISLPSRSWCR